MDVKLKIKKVSSTHFKKTILDINDNVLWDSGNVMWFHETGLLQTKETISDMIEQLKEIHSDWNFIEIENDFK